jgi:release factor glutamine methyltransferase
MAEALHEAELELAYLAVHDPEFDYSLAPRLEAEALLRGVLGISRVSLLARVREPLADEHFAAFRSAVVRRTAHEPLAYIVGHREFYGVEIECRPGVLIPRWESEMLVEISLERARKRDRAIRVADVGTGSGAIAVAVAANVRNVEVVAIDTSPVALALARGNIERNGVADRVTVAHNNLLDGLGMFDVIVANLPYVTESEWPVLEPEIREHEPRSALVAGATGTEVIESMLRSAPGHLSDGGVVAVEIGATQGSRVTAIARESFPRARIELMRDLAGLDRVLAVYTKEDS